REDGSLVEGRDYFAQGDARRRALGVPRVDRAVYAQENGWAVEALCDLADATGDASAREQAVAAARAVDATHRAPGGGWTHAQDERETLHLGDQASLRRALVRLSGTT